MANIALRLASLVILTVVIVSSVSFAQDTKNKRAEAKQKSTKKMNAPDSDERKRLLEERKKFMEERKKKLAGRTIYNRFVDIEEAEAKKMMNASQKKNFGVLTLHSVNFGMNEDSINVVDVMIEINEDFDNFYNCELNLLDAAGVAKETLIFPIAMYGRELKAGSYLKASFRAGKDAMEPSNYEVSFKIPVDKPALTSDGRETVKVVK